MSPSISWCSSCVPTLNAFAFLMRVTLTANCLSWSGTTVAEPQERPRQATRVKDPGWRTDSFKPDQHGVTGFTWHASELPQIGSSAVKVYGFADHIATALSNGWRELYSPYQLCFIHVLFCNIKLAIEPSLTDLRCLCSSNRSASTPCSSASQNWPNPYKL